MITKSELTKKLEKVQQEFHDYKFDVPKQFLECRMDYGPTSDDKKGYRIYCNNVVIAEILYGVGMVFCSGAAQVLPKTMYFPGDGTMVTYTLEDYIELFGTN